MDMRIKGSENCRRGMLGHPVRNLLNGAVQNRATCPSHYPKGDEMEYIRGVSAIHFVFLPWPGFPPISLA
jgi:hypothetical protein